MAQLGAMFPTAMHRSHILEGAAVAYWLGRRIQDRNEDFEREFDSRWWIQDTLSKVRDSQ